MRSTILVFGVLLALAFCLPGKQFNFIVGDYFKGSWKIERREYSIGEGDPVEVMETQIYNVTVKSENLLKFGRVMEETNEIDASSTFEMSVLTNRSCTVVGEGSNFAIPLKFVPYYDKISYIAVIASESGEYMEVLVDGPNHFTIQKHDSDKLVHLNAIRNVAVPVPTFFQKYGNFIMMGVMMLVQLITTKLRPAPPQQEEEGEQKEGEASTEDKPKSD